MGLINLLPEDYLARQAQKRANLLCALLFSVVMAGVLGSAVVSEQGYRHTHEVRGRVDESYAQAGKVIDELQNLEAVRGKMLIKARMTASLLERVPRSYLLATITNALPKGASLTRFDMTAKRERTIVLTKDGKSQHDPSAGKKGEESAAMSVTITLEGLAGTDVDVARFMAAMARCPLTEAVDLGHIVEKKVTEYRDDKPVAEHVAREFQLVMRLKNDADVRAATSDEAAFRNKSDFGLRASGLGVQE